MKANNNLELDIESSDNSNSQKEIKQVLSEGTSEGVGSDANIDSNNANSWKANSNGENDSANNSMKIDSDPEKAEGKDGKDLEDDDIGSDEDESEIQRASDVGS